MHFLPEEVKKNKCKVCDKSFKSQKLLHAHLKEHKLIMAEYYTKYFPRYNLLTRDPLPFKRINNYFLKDFETRAQFSKWLTKANEKTRKEYITNVFLREKEYKNLKHAPNYIDLTFHPRLISMEEVKEYCGSYYKLMENCGLNVFYDKKLPEGFLEEVPRRTMQIDTREQNPLFFENSISEKINYGDYCFVGESISVERKSLQDLIGTLTQGYERFDSEIKRCIENDGYMFIVTECDLLDIKNYNKNNRFKINTNALYIKIRDLTEKYREHIQFVFSGSREVSQELIPKLLHFGKGLQKVDLQYFLSYVD